MRRIIPTTGLMLLLPLVVACTRESTRPEARKEADYAQRYQAAASELRQIEAVRAFTLYYETNSAAALAIGEFRKLKPGHLEDEHFSDHFPFYVILTTDGNIAGYGRVKIKWCPTPLVEPFGDARISTNIRMIWVMGPDGPPLPNPFETSSFTAIFSVKNKWLSPTIKDDLVVYEIPPTWTSGAIAVLSDKASLDDPALQTSSLGTVFRFLHSLRTASTEFDSRGAPMLMLHDLITNKADPQLIETLLYLAIHPATRNPHAKYYWEMLINELRNGTISKSSGVRIGKAFGIFAGLPNNKRVELDSATKPADYLNVTLYREGISALSPEDQRFVMARQMEFCVPTNVRKLAWPPTSITPQTDP